MILIFNFAEDQIFDGTIDGILMTDPSGIQNKARYEIKERCYVEKDQHFLCFTFKITNPPHTTLAATGCSHVIEQSRETDLRENV